MEKVTHTFGPVYDEHSEILILGSIPSAKSREYGFYYMHPQNRFWLVLENLFSISPLTTIEERKQFLLNHHIALFDVLSACTINGSSDSSIQNIEVNDIRKIIDESKVKVIFTTGKKATELYQKYCYPTTQMESIYLPSTSPANCAVSKLQLIESYKVILDYLDEKHIL